MFNTAILSLCVLSDSDKVHIVVQGLVSLDGATGSYIGIEIERAAQCEIE